MPHPTNGGSSKLNFTTFANTINGKPSTTKETRHGINPSTEEPLPPVPVSAQQDVDNAVTAARAAFKIWSKTPIEERQKAVEAWIEASQEYSDEFTKLLTNEQGKPLAMASMEFKSTFARLSEVSQLRLPEVKTVDTETRETTVRYTPLGVACGIVPWNFPLSIAMSKIGPAIMTGNAVIIKPSPFTPYCALKLVESAQPFFPPGLIQCLSGDEGLGPMLTSHPGIDKISFTGSIPTGKRVMESASKTLKRVTLELGGNDPCIVCKDVNLETVVPKIAQRSLLNSGQICIAIKRIYVHSSIYDQFRQAYIDFVKDNVKVGDGHAEGVFMGPLQNKMQYERVQTFVSDIKKENWNVAYQDPAGSVKKSGKGYFINPTIIDRPSDTSRIVTEEPFGPILPLLEWTDEDDVIARANDTRTGLGASVWSKDLKVAKRIAEQIESGSVWINTHLEIDNSAPFSGHKESGLGCELGVEGLKSYCNVQGIIMNKE